MNNKGLSSYYIQNKLKKINQFKGVFPINHLNKSLLEKDENIFLIINTDSCRGVGLHWFILEKYKGKIYIFDSLGSILNNYKIIKRILKKNHNKSQIQDVTSSSCGEFCLLFINLRLIGFSYNEILSFFDKNVEYNEKILKKYKKNIFVKNISLY